MLAKEKRQNHETNVKSEAELTIEQLKEKYEGVWGRHPVYPVEDWQSEVENEDTRQGYWEWVHSKIESDGNDPDVFLANNEDEEEKAEPSPSP
jgi:hypothetical protein